MTGCMITLHQDGGLPFDLQLGDFLAENELPSEDLQEMFQSFGHHLTWIGGGGAGIIFAVALSNGHARDLLPQEVDQEIET